MVQCFFNPNYAGNYCGPTYYGTQQEALELLRQKRNAVWNAKYAVEQTEQALDALTNPPSKVKREAELDQQIADQDLRFMDEFSKITI